MKLLIIGKTGQLGSALVNDALLLNHEVIALTRQQLDIGNITNNITDTDNNKFLKILENNQPDIVINTAAFHNVPLCEIEPLNAFKFNFIAVRNMAKICNNLDIQFITFSTDYVFDGKKNKPYIELDIPNPLQIYGLSKLAGEYASLLYENTTIIRTCGLYGLRNKSLNNESKTNFVDSRIKDSKERSYIEISNDQTVSPTYASDLSKAVLELIKYQSIKKQNNLDLNIYHLVNESYCTWYEFTKEIYNILNININVIPVDRKGKDGNMRRPLFSALENEKAKKLGIILPHWKDALKRYLELKYLVD